MVITDEKYIVKLINGHFANITKKLNIKPIIFLIYRDSGSDWFYNHICLRKIKEIYPENVPKSQKNEMWKMKFKTYLQNNLYYLVLLLSQS